jgi:hypothetical protein
LLQFNLLKKNPNVIIDSLQIEISLAKSFNCLLSAEAPLTIIDFPPLAGLFNFNTPFSPEKFGLKNLQVALEEKSLWLLLSSHRITAILHSTFSIIHFNFCKIRCLSRFLDLFVYIF